MRVPGSHQTITADCQAAGGSVADQAFDGAVTGTLISAEIVLNTASSVGGVTVENANGTDVLNGAGAGPFTTNRFITLNDIGGLNVSGPLTAKAATVSGATGTFSVHLHVNTRR